MIQKNKFLIKTYPAKDLSTHVDLLSHTTSLFFKQVLNKFDNNKFFLLLKVQYKNGSYSTYHKGVLVNKDSLKDYLDFLKHALELKADNYTAEDNFEQIIFNYLPIPKEREDQFKVTKWTDLTKKEIVKLELETFDKYKLPLNNDYLKWGKIIHQTKSGNNELMVIKGTAYNYCISTFDGKLYTITLISKNKKRDLITITDQKCYDDFFIRKINNYTFYCNNEKILLFTKELVTKFLATVKPKKLPKCKMITFDIETNVKKGVHKPYKFAMFDGKNKYSWFSDNASELLATMLQKKYKNYSAYAHNLSGFDIIFLHKEIAKLSKIYNIEVLKRESKYIVIKISKLDLNIKLNLKDSLNLLPSSLDKLGEQFDIECKKSIEPIFQGDPNSPYYQGDISHYNKKVKIINDLDEWKKEITDYCINDCVALYQILFKFRELVYEKFKVNIDNYPTIPSLAFAIYRTHYMKENTIPIIKGKMFDFIHESFTGGRTEMFIPYGKNVNVYDVNALYPSSMKNYKFPTGKIIQFQGDIKWLYKLDPKYTKDNSYWIGDAFVETKKDLEKPYLQINHLTTEHGLVGKRTISPNGSFTMKINSPEYDNALKDYNIRITSGFLFESSEIFVEYVDDMYELRQKYSKSDPMNFIAKLFMNSLFGRFAMKPVMSITKYINRDEDLFTFLEKNDIHDYQDIDRETILLTFSNKNNSEEDFGDFKNSISIASAITSYSRVFMSQFTDCILLYMDTDSLFIDGELDPKIVGNELGKFKLEYTFVEVVILGGKVYAGITTDGRYICKIRGFKNSADIPFEDMKSLLNADSSLELKHTKWFRNVADSEILMKEQTYDLVKSTSKRELIIEDGKVVGTKAFTLINNYKLQSSKES